MSLKHILCATALVAGTLAAAPALADPYDGHHDHNGWHDGRHDDRGWHRGSHRHCWTEWHHHHQVRRCR